MIAVDINVLIYACDRSDPRRQQIALELVTNAESGRSPVAGRLRVHLRLAQAQQVGIHVHACLESPRRVPRAAAPRRALRVDSGSAKELHLTRGASFWDALTLAACVQAAVEIFYSEDLPGFDKVDGVRIVNPFT